MKPSCDACVGSAATSLAPPGPVVAGPVTIDRERREVTLAGIPQALTRTEFQILTTLAARQGEAVSREELMLEVWGTAVVGRSRSLDFFIGQIRAKLDGLPLRLCAGSVFGWTPDMGLRVRVVLVVLSLLAVAALAVPLALSLADRRTAALAAERGRQLAALADSAAMPDVPLERLVDRYHQVYGEGFLDVDSDGRTLAARGLDYSGPASRRRQTVRSSTPRRRGGPVSGPGTVARFWRPRVFDATGSWSAPSLWRSTPRVAARDVANGWLWVAIGCLGLLLLAVLVARALTQVGAASA